LSGASKKEIKTIRRLVLIIIPKIEMELEEMKLKRKRGR
jgi:hypothetical protein